MSMNITYTSIYKTSLPVLVSLLMEYLIGFTDTAYLGRVGETELAASAIAGTYYMIIYMIGFGFSIGAQILIAQCNGNRQYKEVGKILSQGILFLLIIAAMVILFYISLPWIRLSVPKKLLKCKSAAGLAANMRMAALMRKSKLLLLPL